MWKVKEDLLGSCITGKHGNVSDPSTGRDLLPQMPADSFHLSALSWCAKVSMGFLQDMLFLLPTPTPSLSKDWLSRYKHPSISAQDRPTLKYMPQSSPELVTKALLNFHGHVVSHAQTCFSPNIFCLPNSLSVPASRKSNLWIWPYLLRGFLISDLCIHLIL